MGNTANVRYFLRKHEILNRKKEIQELFENGSSFFLYPFKVFYLPVKENTPVKVLFSVSKRNHKKAVTRNLIKRRMRECYRQQKHQLQYPNQNLSCYLAFVYISKDIPEFNFLKNKLNKALVRLNNISENNSTDYAQKEN
ncbi:MAG TPA: ribonuclease P protein component [Cytophagales bacterium]|jgi:ribonuclease P protein component|nr:ribonuclease P protein component [Cytophagales bacterium]